MMTQKPSVMLKEDPIQTAVYQLEAYKRRLGRNFDKVKDFNLRLHIFNMYNECENSIAELCDKYKLDRLYKPHKLKIEQL